MFTERKPLTAKLTLDYCAGRAAPSAMFMLHAVVALVLWGTVSTGEAGAEETPRTAESTGETPTPAPGADLAIVKTDSPDPAGVGSILSYTLTVTNTGGTDAAEVVVTDQLPAGLALISATPSQGSCDGGTCNLGTVGAGQGAAVAVAVFVEPFVVASVGNVACVATSTADTNPANDCDDETTTIIVSGPTAAPAPVTQAPNGLPIGGGSPGADSSGGRLLLILGIALTAIGAAVAFRFAGR